MSSLAARRAGLDLLLPHLEDSAGTSMTVAESQIVAQPIYQPGNFMPLPSSAARIIMGDQSAWIPSPLEPPLPEQGQAPLYLHANQVLVMPTIRLWVKAPTANKSDRESSPEYLSLSDWLLDALTRWTFLLPQASRPSDITSTILDQLRQKQEPQEVLKIIASLVRYALLGSDRPFRLAGLRLPPMPMWLRPAGAAALARRAARALVITARLAGPDDDSSAAKSRVPTANLRSESYRLRPAEPCDWGIDPVHTPEGNDIRLTGRLGIGVGVGARMLQTADPGAPANRKWANASLPCPAGPSTARLPFAGYNDPRRLLMAANMQVQAVCLKGEAESPLVRQDAAGPDPPGVNLRVGYLAWKGWNHEDAWVIAESAAKKLTATEDREQVIAIRGIEELPELLVRQGDVVQQGQLLVRRFVAPALLCSSLEFLGKFDLSGGKADLAAEPEDSAPWTGEVLRIQEQDLLQESGVGGQESGVRSQGSGITGQAVVSSDHRPLAVSSLTAHYRRVYRITLRRTLPLTVGDKLANRHGHKGIVGAILADEAMPRWRGRPLEALIDPISVLNRSNWGQVHETLAGAARDDPTLSPDAQGCFVVEPPQKSDGWMRRPARTVAGLQFVMRLPHHACDKLSGSPLPPRSMAPNMHRRQQRFGEMEHWALWAHGVTASAEEGRPLSPAAARLGRLLATAGFGMKQDRHELLVQRLPLHDEAPAQTIRFAFEDGILAGAYDALDEIPPESMTVFRFDPPLCDVPLAEREKVDTAGPEMMRRRKADLVWLPLLPACDRPASRRADGSEELHELTRMLRWVIRLLRKRPADAEPEDDGELRFAVHCLMESALAQAVGLRATGADSSKTAFLRRGVLGQRLGRSARATASPAGKNSLPLALDEIGLPPALAWSLFGPQVPGELDAGQGGTGAQVVSGRRVWLKRDPVLHRWGLLPVRVRLMDGETIRLPASLLGPLGADFDGDTVALFAELPAASSEMATCTPPALSWHGVLERAMFLPGKQYLYGLHLLLKDPERLQSFQRTLAAAGAPVLERRESASAALQDWVRVAAGPGADGRWWAILEDHALAALGDDPSMGFGLMDAAALAALDVVRCGAAKNLYRDVQEQEVMARILSGRSLDIYQHSEHGLSSDPIADVMVAAKASIGRFGGALRRLIYSARAPLSPQVVELAQALTEQVTQKALSVKAGKPPIHFGDYERQLRRLLRGGAWDPAGQPEMRELLAPLHEVWEKLRVAMAEEAVPWLAWLRQPHTLPELLSEVPHETLKLPLDDLRLQSWRAQSSRALRTP